jgi:regulator of replication initiation timing
MTDKLQLLEEKIGQVLHKLEDLKSQNAGLKRENDGLKGDLSRLESDFAGFKLEQNDRAEQVKYKLTALLDRIEELEKIGL